MKDGKKYLSLENQIIKVNLKDYKNEFICYIFFRNALLLLFWMFYSFLLSNNDGFVMNYQYHTQIISIFFMYVSFFSLIQDSLQGVISFLNDVTCFCWMYRKCKTSKFFTITFKFFNSIECSLIQGRRRYLIYVWLVVFFYWLMFLCTKKIKPKI